MSRPELVIIAAVAEKNRVIGKDGRLPWRLSEDLRRFKQLTLGHAALMGRKTFESIVARLGKPLPERRNLVLTSTASFPDFPDVEIYSSLDDALNAAANESMLFVIGGESLYRETLPLAHRLELTIVKGDYDGDAFFPEYRSLLEEKFELVKRDEREGYAFESYRRKT
jgi:dihydrofolate reductase